jgi:hypothetical protein
VKPSHSSFVVQPSRSSLLVWMLLCFIVAFALATLIIQPALAQKKLSAAEAKDHVGETATVCGNVVNTRYAASTKGQPTFLNLDKAYPNHVFTAAIWGNSRSKFGTPEDDPVKNPPLLPGTAPVTPKNPWARTARFLCTSAAIYFRKKKCSLTDITFAFINT